MNTGGADDEDRQFWFWLAALALLLAGLAVFKDILLPFAAGAVLAYALNPLVDRLERTGLGRTFAAALVIGAGAVLAALAIVLVVPLLVGQVQQLAAGLPEGIARTRQVIETAAAQRLGRNFPLLQSAIDNAINELKANGGGIMRSAVGELWTRSLSLLSVLSLILVTPLVVFYLLVDWHPALERVQSWLPRDHAATIDRLAAEINDAVAAFIRGQGAVCLCLGVYYAAALTLAGLNYGAIVGLATGLLAFVPMVGWFVGAAVAIGMAVAQFAPDWTPVLAVLGVMLGGMALDTALLSPKLVGRKVGLHPVWLIFALFAFSSMFGLVGTLVAVPVSAAIAVLARFGIARYLDSEVYRGQTRRRPLNADRPDADRTEP